MQFINKENARITIKKVQTLDKPMYFNSFEITCNKIKDISGKPSFRQVSIYKSV